MGEKPGRILRTSIFSFLQKFQYFTSGSSLLAFPYAAAVLLVQSLITYSPLFPLVRARLVSLFVAAGFPSSSLLFAFLNLKLVQTVLTSFLVSPFSLSSLLLAKASVIAVLGWNSSAGEQRRFVSHWVSGFNALFVTQLCNMLVVLAANATCFFILALLFNVLDILQVSAPGSLMIISAIVYSISLANAYIVCNVALVLSGLERRGGFTSILKASIIIRGRTATALILAVSVNTALAAIEALFQYRIVRSYLLAEATNSATVLEGIFIAYLYAVVLVLDTVVGCVFLRSCKKDHQIDQEDRYYHQREIPETDGMSGAKSEVFVEILP